MNAKEDDSFPFGAKWLFSQGELLPSGSGPDVCNKNNTPRVIFCLRKTRGLFLGEKSKEKNA